MAKLMTTREMEILKIGAWYKHQYHESNPEVGWGKTYADCVKELAEQLSFAVDEDDIAEICENVGVDHSGRPTSPPPKKFRHGPKI